MKANIRFSVLASGSSGNSCYIETRDAKILVDAGLSCTEIVRRLKEIGVRAESLDSVIITHEHGDHIKGAGPLVRRYDLPICINRKTLERGSNVLGNLPKPVILRTGQTVSVKDLCVETFTKCHDAADPLGLVVSCDGIRLGFVTDLGRSTRLVEDRLQGCHGLIIEFNYDPEILRDGPYHLQLKRRISGPEGHFSNQQAGELLATVSGSDMKCVVLAHLSKINNRPEKAQEAASKALTGSSLKDTLIFTSGQDEPSPLIEL